jgi:hypothetical protein
VFRAPRVLRGHERRGRSERTMRRAARFLGDGASGIWERRRREQKNRGAGRGDGAALCWRNRGAGRRTALATYAATTEQIDGASGSWERRRRERKNRGARRGDGAALCWRNRGAGRLTPQRRIKERPLDNYIVVEIMHYIQRQGMTNCDLLKRCNITNRKKYML